MAKSGRYGNTKVEYFNGGLFADGDVPPLTPADIEALHEAAAYD